MPCDTRANSSSECSGPYAVTEDGSRCGCLRRDGSRCRRWVLPRKVLRPVQLNIAIFPGIGSRNIVWVIAQLHLLLAGFVLGVPIFAWLCEIVGWKSGEKRYDKLAKEFTKLLTSSYATTALFGGILLFLLIGFYPKLMNYLTDIFFPSFVFYCILFLLETATLYLYWYGWDAMSGRWNEDISSFPGVPAEPLRVLHHDRAELLGHVPSESGRDRRRHGLGAGLGRNLESDLVAGQHPSTDRQRRAGRIYLRGLCRHPVPGSRNAEERDHYDWMGYVGNFIGVFGLLPLPFAGYWLMREIYQYNQQMGITLMGGFLSWLFILQAMLIGVLFLGSNYYFWLGITYRIPGSEMRYRKPIMTMLIILLSVPRRLDDAALAGRQPRGSAQNGRHAPSAARRLRRHVGEDDRGQSDDPRHVHELHYVLARRQSRKRPRGPKWPGPSWPQCSAWRLSL